MSGLAILAPLHVWSVQVCSTFTYHTPDFGLTHAYNYTMKGTTPSWVRNIGGTESCQISDEKNTDAHNFNFVSITKMFFFGLTPNKRNF